ncbi:substrate-binding domain-containing protein [Conexibacter sp. CPCC 206217]|uniref:substrate-binding domain-containing protein n=1 Tax=Conexibacter sp. CPCC 206217 TaxID=3064574 RepID=UPI002719881F|nr:substrate-binding domain-containing protein [Conexibacter sp. CPCC 206217]MDO8208841.1 substrate-binding domain-containing protein [Conexibacter sp. CPCC 206217]
MSLPTPDDSRRLNRRQLVRGAAAAGVGGSAMALLAACGKTSDSSTDSAAGGNGGVGNFPRTPRWRFVVVCHATTNSFFTATQYGVQDAAAMVDSDYQWTGSANGDVSEMLNAMNAAITAKADGIALSMVDPRAFDGAVEKAIKAGIPVIAFSSDAPDSDRLAYVGSDNYAAGIEMGRRIVDLVGGSGDVVLFAAQPGAEYATPRIRGTREVLEEAGIGVALSASGFTINESVSRVEAYWQGHKSVKGLYGLDAYATQAIGQVIKKNDLRSSGMTGGGYDALEQTLKYVADGSLDFTIDEQQYLQGFYPIVSLFLTKISGGQTGPADMNLANKVVTRADVAAYIDNPSRFLATTRQQKVISPS